MARSPYRPANCSTRRRRLAIRLSHDADAVRSFTSSGASRSFALETVLSASDVGTGFLKLVESESPLTWLFAGDSLSAAGRQPARGGSFVSYLVRMIRDRIGRTADAFVTTAAPEQRLAEVLEDLQNQVVRFGPDIVVLSCGLMELLHLPETSLAYESAFHQLIQKIHERGAVAIINTPPYVLLSDETQLADRLIRLEAIRACAVESLSLLVDHWAHWEVQATPDWYRSDGIHSAERGAVEMARLFVHELRLDQLESSRKVPEYDSPAGSDSVASQSPAPAVEL